MAHTRARTHLDGSCPGTCLWGPHLLGPLPGSRGWLERAVLGFARNLGSDVALRVPCNCSENSAPLGPCSFAPASTLPLSPLPTCP